MDYANNNNIVKLIIIIYREIDLIEKKNMFLFSKLENLLIRYMDMNIQITEFSYFSTSTLQFKLNCDTPKS